MATATETTAVQTPARPRPADQLPSIRGPRLPFHPLIEERFGIDRASWKALVEAIFPGATSIESVILALSYCKARKLDPFKKNVHIVPIWNKDQGCYVDTIWPGIGELRTTAFRTSEYAGRGETVSGPDVTMKIGSLEMTFPQWSKITVYRMVKGQRVEFVGPTVYWLETYAQKKHNDETPNEMWAGRPRGQLEKCAEAAALRAAFPEECGGDYIPEEVQHGKPSQDRLAHETARAGLDTLTEKLEEESSNEPEPVEGAWETFAAELAATDTEKAAEDVCEEWFGGRSKFAWTAEQVAKQLELLEVRQADIRKRRGSESTGSNEDWQTFTSALALAENLRDADAVGGHWVGKFTPAQNTEGLRLVEARKEEILAKRPGNKQQPLIDKGQQAPA